MRKTVSRFIFLVLSFTIISSCDTQLVYDNFQHIDDARWHWDDPVDFAFPVADTISSHNILIRLRHSSDYPLSNLYMFVNFEGPSGQTLQDTINFILAENNGKWVGSGNGNIREVGYLFKKNIRFPEIGEYQVSIEQAMRLPEVPVSDLGLRVEKINP